MTVEQGSPEWFAMRLGKVTASRVADVIARTKTGWGASRANYAAQLVAERLTGKVADSFTNGPMQRGTEQEEAARRAYEFMSDAEIVPADFVPHPTIGNAGASPDGFIGEEGLVEIKCPNTATHIDTLLGRSIPGKYITQMQWQMACTGRRWCDFVSYDNRMPPSMMLFTSRVMRDEVMIADLQMQVRDFLKEVDATVADLLTKYNDRSAA